MDSRLILTFMDGHRLEASLARPFRSQENEIEVQLNDNGGRTVFPLDEVCSIGMMGAPDPGGVVGDRECLEEVETVTGERYPVYTDPRQRFSTGFYGSPAEAGTPFRCIFFTSHGIRTRSKERHVGEILEDRGVLSDADLQETLAAQQELRTRRVGDIIAEAGDIRQEAIETALRGQGEYCPLKEDARVGDILIAARLITRAQVDQALDAQAKGRKVRIGALLIERGLISEDQLLTALAIKFRMRFIDLDTVTPAPEALQALTKGIVNQLRVVPLEATPKKIVVATAEPTDSSIVDSLRFITNRSVELVVARSQQIAAMADKYYNHPEDFVDTLIGKLHDEQLTIVEQPEESRFIEPDSKVIQLVNRILLDAQQREASDIHFEPGLRKTPFIVRYRVDGECFIAHQIPPMHEAAIISRLKIIAKLDIAEHRRPQSGKILLRSENRELEYRLEITPTVGGQEDAVLRLLTASKPLPLEEMGFSPSNLAKFREILTKPYGMILCVGPTGSGKTTTLHSALAQINSPERKIWTAEDPVEIVQRGLRQVQVNPKIGFTFQEALRSFLRADPDVIMIGEMRDAETAKTAIAASLTGHLVFSTLHTNSAPETVVRLIEMGMEPYNFADALLGIMAQRLARKLCVKCKVRYHPSPAVYEELVNHYSPELAREHDLPPYADTLSFMRRTGCATCNGTGYKGRIALHEILTGTPGVKDAIKGNAKAEELRGIGLQEGMRTLKMDGIHKVFQGITDLDQVMKVCMV
jgi:type II secretory ATPase GspE/PulE/Tfp pilus assembly ATPase PilB-like protein